MNWNYRVTTLLRWIVLASVAMACASTRADSWRLTPEVKETTNVFGKTKVVLHYDSMKGNFPRHTLRIYRGEELLAQHKDVGFEQVFADKENRFFLGVSNGGLVNPAWVVFDRDGRIIKQQPHGPLDVKYCSMSVTLVREWYDAKQPEVQFKVEGGALQEVSLRDCQGQRIRLSLEVKAAPPDAQKLK